MSRVIVIIAAVVNLIAMQANAEFSFLGIDIPGFSVSGVSADGNILAGGVSGVGTQPARQAVIWTRQGELQRLKRNGLDQFSNSFGISGDGNTVIGFWAPCCGEFVRFHKAMTWKESTGIVDFGQPEFSISQATDANFDASIVVGHHSGRPYRWTQATGWMHYPTSVAAGQLIGTSSNGDSLTGFRYVNNLPMAFRWSIDQGAVDIGDLEGGITSSNPSAISAAGDVIVGVSSGENGQEAFKWTADGGMLGLGHLFSGISRESAATDISADGTVIVGYSQDSTSGSAFVWTESTGMLNLQSYLLENGVDVGGWKLRNATAVSDDGRVIVGQGYSPTDLFNVRSWVATIDFPIIGDYDGNGRVQPDDYEMWKRTFGSTAVLNADGNINGVIDAADYVVWRDSVSDGSGQPANIPEPCSVLLLTLASLFLTAQRFLWSRTQLT